MMNAKQSKQKDAEEARRRRLRMAAQENAEESGNGENDARTQTSLEIGSRTYKEYVHDSQMNSNTDFSQVSDAQLEKTQKRYVQDKNNKAKEKTYSKAERDDNMKITQEMKTRNQQSQKQQRDKVNQRKAYTHIKKEDLEDDAMQTALDMAAETETKADDKRMNRRMPKTLETIKYDDGVTEDDYLKATSKAARKYM